MLEFYVYNYECDQQLYDIGVNTLMEELSKSNIKVHNIDTKYISDLGDQIVKEFCDYALNSQLSNCDLIDQFIKEFARLHRAYMYIEESSIEEVLEYLTKVIRQGMNGLNVTFLQSVNQFSKYKIPIVFTSKKIDCFLGSTKKSFSLVISSYMLQGNISPEHVCETFKTVVLHELGHLCGLVESTHRKRCSAENANLTDEALRQLEANHQDGIADSHGWHCLNKCVMRQRNEYRYWFEDLTKDRIGQTDPYCPLCRKSLSEFYAQHT